MRTKSLTLSGTETDSKWYYHTHKNIQDISFTNLENGSYTLCITKPNYKPLIKKVNIGTEYIQNESITDDVLYLSNDILVGSHVTSTKPSGNVIIKSGASVSFNAIGNILLDKGFICEKGGTLEIK